MRSLTLAAPALGLALASCSPTPGAVPKLSGDCPVKMSGDWTVRVTQGGGFTGMIRTIEITSRGTLNVAEGRLLERTISGALTKTQMDQLLELMNSVKARTPPNPKADCADCGSAELHMISGGWTCSTRLEGMSADESGVGRLVGFMSALGQLAAAGKLAPVQESEVRQVERRDPPRMAATSESELPQTELLKLRSVASWTGDTLRLNVYNGTKWRVTRLYVRVGRYVGGTLVDAPRPLVLNPPAERAEPDGPRLPAAVGLDPGNTGPFEGNAGQRTDHFSFKIESARGFAPG